MKKPNKFMDDTELLLRQEWGDSPAILSVCVNILKYLNEGADAKSHLNFYRLYSISGEVDPSIVLKAVYVLVNEKFNVLEQRFEVINPENNRYEEVSVADVVNAINNKDFAHPITGEEISEEDYKMLVVPFFSPSNRVIGIEG